MISVLRRVLLFVAIPIMLTHAAYQVTGCSSVLKEIESVNDPKDDVALSDCRKAMREAKDAGADAAEAFRAYFDCTVEAGLR